LRLSLGLRLLLELQALAHRIGQRGLHLGDAIAIEEG
jgi:hypothetical protein